MHLDVLDLRTFYYRTQLGRGAQAAIRAQVTTLWPEAKGQNVAGFGFAAPLLRPYLSEARRVTALMPGQQGVMPWPAGMANVSVLCEETQWPVETDSIHKLIVMHGLEASEHPIELLEECYRVLSALVGLSRLASLKRSCVLWACCRRAMLQPFINPQVRRRFG